MTIALRYTVRSDVGLLRDGNEDSAYAGPHLLAIADGMGGHAAGEVASAVAIKTLAPLDAQIDGPDMLQALGDAIADANSALHQIAAADPATEGMGTTLTALLWSGDELALCHIGDSRAYMLRDGALQQITHDHTLVQSLVDDGRLTPEEAAAHPQRSLVMRALQSSIPADPDLAMLSAQVGDRFLLCSDGLTDVVSDETLQYTLQQLTDLDAAVEQLVDLAIRSGGPDNITCVLADVIDTDAGQAPSEQVIIVGALVAEDGEGTAGWETTRSDNPAARAHMLTQGTEQAEAGAEVPDVGEGGSSDEAGDDTEEEHAQVVHRRWPLVTCVLALLVGVVGAAGYYGWRLTQSQYYVGTADGRVVVFRGLSQAVAGLSLSSVVQRTDIPLAALPKSEVDSIKSTIGPVANLGQARRIVSQFRHDYKCAIVQASITKWAADRPKPPRKVNRAPRHHSKTPARHPAPKRTATSRPVTPAVLPAKSRDPAGTNSTGKHSTVKRSVPKQAKYPPEPVLPSFCPASTGAAG
jgi:PPM family protein phosphatase